MAHKRKDTLTPSPEWWRHLRPFNKRKVAKAERNAAKAEIEAELAEAEEARNVPRSQWAQDVLDELATRTGSPEWRVVEMSDMGVLFQLDNPYGDSRHAFAEAGTPASEIVDKMLAEEENERLREHGML